MEDWIIGMILVFVGCCCSAVGLILLKHSTSVEEHLPLHKRPFWAVGVVFLIVNASVIDVIAFSLAPLTLVAPFSGVTILLTTWLASSGMLFVKETVDAHDMISTALALVGVTITTAFGPHIDDAKGANELSACFGQTDVHIFAAVSMGIFGASWLAYLSNRRLRQATWFRICVYAYTAALAGSASMLLLKVVGTGMRGYIESSYSMDSVTGIFIGSLVGLVFCAIVQLSFLHRTLANSPVSYGVPTYQVQLRNRQCPTQRPMQRPMQSTLPSSFAALPDTAYRAHNHRGWLLLRRVFRDAAQGSRLVLFRRRRLPLRRGHAFTPPRQRRPRRKGAAYGGYPVGVCWRALERRHGHDTG